MGQLETLRNGKKAAVLEALRKGNTRSAASEAAGISRETFYTWLKTDLSLSDEVARAEAEAEQTMVAAIHAAATGTGVERDWRASESWLKRRRRQEYGDSLDLRRLDDEQLLRLIEAAATRGGETRPDGPADAADGGPEGSGTV